SARGGGLLRKLMLRLVVTASGTQPIDASTAIYIARSLRPIMATPEIVPPGRSARGWKACRTRQPRCQTLRIDTPFSRSNMRGNSADSRRSSSSAVSLASGMRRPPAFAPRIGYNGDDHSQSLGPGSMSAPHPTARVAPSPPAILEREDLDGIAVLTLNRPKARNSLSDALIAALAEAP